MTERDPRTDPRPGDVLRNGEGNLEVQKKVTLVGRNLQFERTQPSHQHPVYRIPMVCKGTKAAWRRWAKNAEVIARGAE